MVADAFFRNLQRLLVEGDFASTYKFALLLSVTRWAVEHPWRVAHQRAAWPMAKLRERGLHKLLGTMQYARSETA